MATVVRRATPTQAAATAYKAGAPVQKIFPGVAGGAAWVKYCGDGRCALEEGAWYWGAHLRTVPHLEDAKSCCGACLATISVVKQSRKSKCRQERACMINPVGENIDFWTNGCFN
mgnify:CR=1 FL=1